MSLPNVHLADGSRRLNKFISAGPGCPPANTPGGRQAGHRPPTERNG